LNLPAAGKFPFHQAFSRYDAVLESQFEISGCDYDQDYD
jgi:hypothetical protein